MRKTFFSAVIMLVLQSPCAAQTKPETSGVPYSQVILNPRTDNIGPAYRGFDPALIYRAVEALGAHQAKSAFETTADYEGRRTTFSALQLLPGIPMSSRLSFVLNDPAANVILSGVSLLYDADAQTLLIKV